MTVHPTQPAGSPAQGSSLDAKLAKLQEREAALRAQGQQLQERAAHLARIRSSHSKRLSRRADTHEKVVLGALVKKAKLDVCRLDVVITTKRHLNDDKTTSFDRFIDNHSTNYDRELILGGLLWLANVLTAQPGGVVTVPPHDGLREAGRLAGANVLNKA